jgi:DNA repair protein RadC
MNQIIKQSIKAWPRTRTTRERLLTQVHKVYLMQNYWRFFSVQAPNNILLLNYLILIQHFGGLNPIFDASLEDLNLMASLLNMPNLAVKELGRRYLNNYFHQQRLCLDHSSLVLDYLRYELQGEKQEVFAVLCLDAELRKYISKNSFSVHIIHVLFH